MTKNELKAIEEWREYLAGPCDAQDGCPEGEYNGHKHYTAWYENNRSTVVALNHLLAGELDYFDRLRELQPTRAEADET